MHSSCSCSHRLWSAAAHLSREHTRPSKVRPSCRDTMMGRAPCVGLPAGACPSRASTTTCAFVTTSPPASRMKPDPLQELEFCKQQAGLLHRCLEVATAALQL